jgi:hypothetical protein
MKNKISIFQIMQAFEASGFTFYEFGSVKENGKKIATFYKGERLKEETRQKLKSLLPSVFFLGSSCQFAPEIKSSLVCIPTK